MVFATVLFLPQIHRHCGSGSHVGIGDGLANDREGRQIIASVSSFNRAAHKDEREKERNKGGETNESEKRGWIPSLACGEEEQIDKIGKESGSHKAQKMPSQSKEGEEEMACNEEDHENRRKQPHRAHCGLVVLPRALDRQSSKQPTISHHAQLPIRFHFL